MSIPAHLRFARHYYIDSTSDCWVWTGDLSTQGGYPTFADDAGRIVYSHRWMFEQAFGKIPAGHIDHRCNLNSCVNPAHMAAMTPEQHRA